VMVLILISAKLNYMRKQYQGIFLGIRREEGSFKNSGDLSADFY
jgi:hypothetical protein